LEGTILITVSVTIGDRKITLEGPEDFVQGEVRRLTDLLAASPVSSRSSSLAPETDQEARVSERDFVDQKKPRGHGEHIAVLAFHMAFVAQPPKVEFTDDEIRRAYIRAGVKPPKAVGQAIRDAARRFDFFESTSTRGNYRITQHGENFVRFDLPKE
jgi:hypothetical protein